MYILRSVAILIVVLETCFMLKKCVGISEDEFLEHGVCESKGGTCLKPNDSDDVHLIDDTKDIVKVFTFASDITDGYQRFNRSAGIYGVKVETLGMGVQIKGDDDDDLLYTGGGYKLNLLKRALKRLTCSDQTIVLYTDSCNVIYTQSIDEIVRKFREINAGVLFAAERYASDETIKHMYPTVEVGFKYLSAGMFMGYLHTVKELLNESIRNSEDDQLFLARAYLDERVRIKLNLKLDHRCEVFQNLLGAIADVQLDLEHGEPRLLNTAQETLPGIVRGSGPAQMFLNNYGNYLAGAFVDGECDACKEQVITLPPDAELPRITLAVFIVRATPFFSNFLKLVQTLDYPQSKLDVFVHNSVGDYAEEIRAFIASNAYASVRVTSIDDNLDEAMARNQAVSHAQQTQSEYLFVIDTTARLDNAQTLRELLRQNRTLIAPMLTRHEQLWSNFWGALSESGYYARSHDYVAIADESIRGIWNVPYVSSCYLAKKAILPAMNFYDQSLEADMALCKQLRKQGTFMYVSNQVSFGHLVNEDDYNPLQTRPDFYTMLSNPRDWEHEYIHPDYAEQLQPNFTHAQPCPDVFWFPIVTERFAADLIAIMETFGKWSDGSSSDDRLKGGYEAVPTRDIHMNQVGLQEQWLAFLQNYVRPLQEAVYAGYVHNPPEALMNFVVRYKPTEQAFLKPHHDTSTYTINIALNRVGIDYEGGGCRFVRYNCAVTDTKVGHMLMHPGRMTHYHEGLHVTNGTRYIMVSFVDP